MQNLQLLITEQSIDPVQLYFTVAQLSKTIVGEEHDTTHDDKFLQDVAHVLSLKPYTSYTEQSDKENLINQLINDTTKCNDNIAYVLTWMKLKLCSSSTSMTVSKSTLLKLWSQCIDMKPQCPLAYYGRAQYLLFKILDPFSAISDLNVAIDLVKKSNVPVTCVDLFILLADAISMVETEDAVLNVYNDAIQALDASSAAKDEVLKLHVLRANIYKNQHRIEDAIMDCGKIIELEPNVADHYNERALLYKHKKRWPEALADLNAMVALEPNCIQYYLYRYELYVNHLQDYDKAQKDLEFIIESDPLYGKAYHLLAQLKLDKQKLEPSSEIEALFEKWTEVEPTSNAYYLRGEFYEYALKNKEQAKHFYQIALDLDTDELAILAEKRLKLLA